MMIHWTDYPERVETFGELLSILETLDRHEMESGFTAEDFQKERGRVTAYTIDFHPHNCQHQFHPRLDQMPGLERLLDHFGVDGYPTLTQGQARELRRRTAKAINCDGAAFNAMSFKAIMDALELAAQPHLAIRTFGDFLANVRGVEQAAASARAHAAGDEPGSGYWRMQAAVFEADADYCKHPSFPHLEAHVNRAHGEFTYTNVLKLRGEVCGLRHCGTREADELPVEEVAAILKCPGTEVSTVMPNAERRVNTTPKCVEPPNQNVDAAMRALPAALNNAPQPRGVNDPAGRRGAAYAILRQCLERASHNRDAVEWAIHRHAEVGRLEAAPGRTTTPGVYRDGGWATPPVTNLTYDRELCLLLAMPSLWDWWKAVENGQPVSGATVSANPPIPPVTNTAPQPQVGYTMNDIRDLLRYEREYVQYEAWCRSTFKPVLKADEFGIRAASLALSAPQPGRLSEESASVLAVYRRLLRESLKVLNKELDEQGLLYFVGEVADRHKRQIADLWSISTDEFGQLFDGNTEPIQAADVTPVVKIIVPNEPPSAVTGPNQVPAGNPPGFTRPARNEGGRPKLGEGSKATTEDKALRNVYELVRAAVQPGWGPSTLYRHFRDNKDFKDRVKEAQKNFDEPLFKNALAWIKENPDQET
jgi:hypothetical protein